jgi:hypothetical protein
MRALALKWKPDAPAWHVLGTVAAVLAVSAALAAGLGVVWIPTSIGGEALTELAAQVEGEPAGAGCRHCGWIESKREVSPQMYEYTVRMRDGSRSVFQEALPVTWRQGERLLVY